MNDFANLIPNAFPWLIMIVVWVALMIFLRWKLRSGNQKALEKQNQILEQQLAVLREISETLRQLRATRG